MPQARKQPSGAVEQLQEGSSWTLPALVGERKLARLNGTDGHALWWCQA